MNVKKHLIYPLFYIVFILLYGCAATPYQPMQNTMPAGGYQEEKLDGNTYMLHFSGNGHSKLEKVIEYWNRRATELCPDGFTLLDQDKSIAHAEVVTNIYVLPHLSMPYVVNSEIPYVHGKIECKN